MFCPGIFHAPGTGQQGSRPQTNWASALDPSLPYGQDFITVMLDFVNKTL